jgi:transcriptional regulator with XRE-family HTH domain
MPRTATSDLAARRVGAEIRRARQGAGLTQDEVAQRLDSSAPYISNVEAGRVNLTLGQLARIADALGCDFEVTLPPIEFAVPAITLPDSAADRDEVATGPT